MSQKALCRFDHLEEEQKSSSELEGDLRETLQRDDLSELERDLLEGFQQILAHKRGEIWVPTWRYRLVTEVDVKKIRESMCLTQKLFAIYIGTSLRTVRDWEAGRRKPTGPALRLLYVLQHNPNAVHEARSTLISGPSPEEYAAYCAGIEDEEKS